MASQNRGISRSAGALSRAAARRIKKDEKSSTEKDAAAKAKGEKEELLRKGAATFRDRLIQRINKLFGGDSRKFERKCGISHGTFGGWQADSDAKDYATKLPNGTNLLFVAANTDTSIDWLLGFKVSRDVRQREQEFMRPLADELARHVLEDLVNRRPERLYVGDIAEFLGAQVTDRREENGRTILEFPAPSEFLGRVCVWAAESVAERARQNDSAEQESVRDHVIELLTRVSALADYERHRPPGGPELMSKQDAEKKLLAAARAPLATQRQRDLARVTDAVEEAEEVLRQHWAAEITELHFEASDRAHAAYSRDLARFDAEEKAELHARKPKPGGRAAAARRRARRASNPNDYNIRADGALLRGSLNSGEGEIRRAKGEEATARRPHTKAQKSL